MTQSKKISVYKSLSWRMVATLTTFLISWAVTGSLAIGLGIASIEFWLKILIYYVHERAWIKIGNTLEN